jgi:hypothetical protein
MEIGINESYCTVRRRRTKCRTETSRSPVLTHRQHIADLRFAFDRQFIMRRALLNLMESTKNDKAVATFYLGQLRPGYY